MSVRYKYSGLTPELYQRLVSEHAALRKAHKKGSYKQFFQDVKQCSEVQARINTYTEKRSLLISFPFKSAEA